MPCVNFELRTVVVEVQDGDAGFRREEHDGAADLQLRPRTAVAPQAIRSTAAD